ncbi:MAG: hypothetical protein E6R13_00670 [Spirochaetes bacterium]|nr:MAG: hypothetical protein E6R13_00670 [Spirochaetota bacterium]
MLNRRQQNLEEIDLNIVGSSTFGKYPTISDEKTYNMYISDGCLVNYAGYESVISGLSGNGRGIAYSKSGKMIAVLGQTAYLIFINYDPVNDIYVTELDILGNLQTYTGYVFISENIVGQILFSDSQHLYLYDVNNITTPFQVLNIDFVPGKIEYQNGYFIANSIGTSQWRLSAVNDGTLWPFDAQHVADIETKASNCTAIVRNPSGSNLLFVFGTNCVEMWFDAGLQIFPYQKNQSFNIDYGVINPSTIAAIDNMVVWLAQNEKAGFRIMYSTGSNVEQITTDGIAYFISKLTKPNDCDAFIFNLDNHIFYQINWYTDNVSLMYDFSNNRFYHVTDENQNHHIARAIVNLNNRYYFVSKDTNKIYSMSSDYTQYDGKEIPRIRITKTFRRKNQRAFKVKEFGLTIEQGTTNYGNQNLGNFEVATSNDKLVYTSDGDQVVTNLENIVSYTPRVDASVSKDGGISFGNYVHKDLNHIGKRQNILRYYNVGRCNAFTVQVRFYNLGRVVVGGGSAVVENF